MNLNCLDGLVVKVLASSTGGCGLISKHWYCSAALSDAWCFGVFARCWLAQCQYTVIG